MLYLKMVKNDIEDFVIWNYSDEQLREIIANEGNLDSLYDDLYDSLFINDSVTGNASGSYYCNSYKAREMVLDNMDTVAEALREFCVPAEEIGERFLREDWEYLDVTARCYILGQALGEVLAEFAEDLSE